MATNKKTQTSDSPIIVSAASCKYNPYKDIMQVVPDLGVNIDDMLQTGVVKDSGETLDNNGIDDPSAIIGRVSDVFDAMDAARIVKKYGKKAPAKAQQGISQIADNSQSDN